MRQWRRTDSGCGKQLGLDSAEDEFKVIYGSIAKDDKEIAILSRSVLEIIIDLASYIEVPAKHVEENQVNLNIVESHIEIGVGASTVEEYLKDKKLRVMLLLPGADLPHIVSDPYQRYLLPLARIVKVYSVLLNLVGKAGPIPEGMSATAALRTQDYDKRHKAITDRLSVKAEKFKPDHGYEPPYWQLVKLARVAKEEAEKDK